MTVQEKCPSCQAEVEIQLEDARKQNACPQCGHTFIPRHAINRAGFSAAKPSTSSTVGAAIFSGVLVVLGVVAAIFISWLIGLIIVLVGAIIYAVGQAAARRH